MKKVSVLLAVVMLSTSMFAQSNKEDIDLIQSIFGKEKKGIGAALHDYSRSPECQVLDPV